MYITVDKPIQNMYKTFIYQQLIYNTDKTILASKNFKGLIYKFAQELINNCHSEALKFMRYFANAQYDYILLSIVKLLNNNNNFKNFKFL